MLRLYGIATELMPHGGSKEGTVILGELDTSGDIVKLLKSTSTSHVHILDAMSSGCGLVVDGELIPGCCYLPGLDADVVLSGSMSVLLLCGLLLLQ